MKKLLFIYGPLGGGGAERVLIDVLNNLDHSRYEVDLCLMVNGGVLLAEVPQQVRVIPLWSNYNLHYKIAFRLSKWFGSNFLFKRKLKQKLSKKYDVEISFLEGMPLKLHALMNSQAKKISWVHCDLFHFHYTNHQFFKGEELLAYNKMDVVVSVSEFANQAFQKRFPTNTSEKKVVYNPIDIDKITRLANQKPLKKNECFTIVIVGRLTAPKKMDRVIRLAARLNAENRKVKIQIIGDGELRVELEKLSKTNGTIDVIEFIGFVKNPYPYIKNADLMILTSATEGFGLVVAESMALGVPVVATETAGALEIIGNNEFGLICKHDDQSIYDAVKLLLNDKELRENYSIKGRMRATNFKIENTIQLFDDLITSMQK